VGRAADGAARLAGASSTASRRARPSRRSEDEVPHAIMHGLYWLTANLAARGPLVLAVDDAHWSDAASLRWLSHLAARIGGLPVLLLLTARSGPIGPTSSANWGLPGVRPAELCPLTVRLGRRVRDGLGDRAGPELFRARTVHRGQPVPA